MSRLPMHGAIKTYVKSGVTPSSNPATPSMVSSAGANSIPSSGHRKENTLQPVSSHGSHPLAHPLATPMHHYQQQRQRHQPQHESISATMQQQHPGQQQQTQSSLAPLQAPMQAPMQGPVKSTTSMSSSPHVASATAPPAASASSLAYPSAQHSSHGQPTLSSYAVAHPLVQQIPSARAVPSSSSPSVHNQPQHQQQHAQQYHIPPQQQQYQARNMSHSQAGFFAPPSVSQPIPAPTSSSSSSPSSLPLPLPARALPSTSSSITQRYALPASLATEQSPVSSSSSRAPSVSPSLLSPSRLRPPPPPPVNPPASSASSISSSSLPSVSASASASASSSSLYQQQRPQLHQHPLAHAMSSPPKSSTASSSTSAYAPSPSSHSPTFFPGPNTTSPSKSQSQKAGKEASLPTHPLASSSSSPLPSSSGASAVLTPKHKTPMSKQEQLTYYMKRFFNGDIPPSKIARFDPKSVPRDEKHLQVLAEKGYWRSVAQIADDLLDGHGITKDAPSSKVGDGSSSSDSGNKKSDKSGNNHDANADVGVRGMPHERMGVCNLLLSALIKLSRFHAAQQVLDRFGSLKARDKQYEYYAHLYGEQKGSLVPFNMFVLEASLPHLMGQRLRGESQSSSGANESADVTVRDEDEKRTKVRAYTRESIRLFSVLLRDLVRERRVLKKELKQIKKARRKRGKKAEKTARHSQRGDCALDAEAAMKAAAALHRREEERTKNIHARVRVLQEQIKTARLKIANHYLYMNDFYSAVHFITAMIDELEDMKMKMEMATLALKKQQQEQQEQQQQRLPGSDQSSNNTGGSSSSSNSNKAERSVSVSVGDRMQFGPDLIHLYSFLGRTHIQYGDLTNGTTCFAQAKQTFNFTFSEAAPVVVGSVGDSSSSNAQDIRVDASVASASASASLPSSSLREAVPSGEALMKTMSVQLGLNNALLLLAKCRYTQALHLFSSLLPLDPTNHLIINNLSVCALYTNQISMAVGAFEDLIRQHPIEAMQSALIGNLRSLYELSSSNPAAKHRLIDGLVFLYADDDFTLNVMNGDANTKTNGGSSSSSSSSSGSGSVPAALPASSPLPSLSSASTVSAYPSSGLALPSSSPLPYNASRSVHAGPSLHR